MRQHLVASLGAWGDYRRGAALPGGGGERLPPGGRGVAVAGVDRDGVDIVAQTPRKRERLLGELVPRVLDEDQDAHQTSPSSRSTPTTGAAASAPLPRISACLPEPGGRVNLTISSFGSGRAGEVASSGLRLARSRPGTDG